MTQLQYGLKDRVIVVTGGSRGIGFALARQLLQEKAKVVICARKQEGLDQAVEELGFSDNLMAVPAHIAREDDVNILIEQTKARYERVDVLINNVGMNLLTPSLKVIK